MQGGLLTWTCISTIESGGTRGAHIGQIGDICPHSMSHGPPLLFCETKKSWAPDAVTLLAVSRPIRAARMEQMLETRVPPPVGTFRPIHQIWQSQNLHGSKQVQGKTP